MNDLKETGFVKEIKEVGRSLKEVTDEFIEKIKATRLEENCFLFNGEKWLINVRPFDHSDDIIVEESVAEKYDKFLLIKSGADRIRVVGWCDKKELKKIPARDIYRINKKYYVVTDTNLNNLEVFKIPNKDLILKDEFIINQQEADNLGHSEMISGIEAGLHYFCKKAGIYFKDINQKDECVIEDKTIKIYTRDYLSDEDMLIPEDFYQKNKDRIDIYIMCKIKGGKYNYFGFIKRKIVEETRVVRMTGGEGFSGESEKTRRIFAEQYENLSQIIKIYEEKKEEEIKTEKQNYTPLHVHCDYSVGDGFGTPEYLAKVLKEKGFSSCALTDHGTLAGVLVFQRSCLANDIKPIIGCEFYLSLEDKTKERFHLTVLVKNKVGWKNILKLQDIAARKNFYYRPIINLQDFLENCEGLIVLSGCSSGMFSALLRENKEKAKEYLKLFKEKLKENFYAEIQPQDIEDNQKNMQDLYFAANELKIKSVFTNDVHYPKKEEKEVHDALKAISFKKKFGEAGFSDDCFYFMQEKDIEERLKQRSPWMLKIIKEILENTNEVAEKCEFLIEADEDKDTLPDFFFNDKDNKNLKEVFEDFYNWLPKTNKEEKKKYLLNYYPKVEDE